VRHTLKTWPEPFEATWRGKKPFEIRREDDRRFEAGDTLDLFEWIPTPANVPPGSDGYGATGRRIVASVMHVERGPSWGLPAGLVVLGISTMNVERSS
jgi:hypothetical protein